MSRNILILGGTGTMGKPLVEYLQQEGDNVSVVCRHSKKSTYSNVRYYDGDANNPVFLNKILSSHYNCIVDFCWYSSGVFSRTFQQKLDACDHYFALSSAGVYADCNDLIREDNPRFIEIDPPSSNNYFEYHYEKARIENLLNNSTKNNWTILRPHITYNDNYLPLAEYRETEWLSRCLLGKKVVIPQDMLECKTVLTHGADVAKMIVKMIGNERVFRESINVTSPNFLKWKDVLHIYLESLNELGLDLKIEYIENSYPLIEGFPSYKYRFLCDRLLNRTFSIEKFTNLFGEMKFMSLQDGISQSLKNYLDNHSYKIQVTSGHSFGIQDRIVGETTPLSTFDTIRAKISYLAFRYIPFAPNLLN